MERKRRREKNNGKISNFPENWRYGQIPLNSREYDSDKKKKEETVVNLIIFYGTELLTHSFHFAHFNYAVGTDEKEWPPCELAIVKYSLAEGIAGTYHEFVDPGNKTFR